MNFSCGLSTCNGSYKFSWRETMFNSLKGFWAPHKSREKRTLKNDTGEKIHEGHSSLAASQEAFGEMFIPAKQINYMSVKNLTANYYAASGKAKLYQLPENW